MITKKCLRAGMLVEFRNGEITILAFLNNNKINGKELCLSWNDDSGRCLLLEDYLDDLTYPNKEEFSIDKVYEVGSCYKPFSMDISNRELLWDRNKIGFSLKERCKAASIKLFISTVDSNESPIFIRPLPNNKLEVTCGETSYFTLPLDENFVNLDEITALDDIIYGEIL